MAEKIGVGIIGVGYWGPNLVRNFVEIEECNLLWVCDLNQDRLDYISGLFPGVRVTQDYRDILDDGDVDAVVVATPVETHFAVGRAVLEAEKHAFIEKPMTAKAEEGLELVRMAEKAGLKMGTGHIFLYHPAVIKMKEVLSEGKIGDLFYAHSTRMNPSPSHGNVDVVWDLAVHDISIALYLWGKVPVRVRADGRKFMHGDRFDAAMIELHFSDQTVAYHHVGWLTSAKERCLFVAGKNGSMRFDDMGDEKLKIVGPAKDSRLDTSAQKGHICYAPGEIDVPDLPPAEPLKKECMAFLQSIADGRPMVSDGAFGHAVVQVLEAVSHSMDKSGEMVRLEGVS